jgi:hypothetical protein
MTLQREMLQSEVFEGPCERVAGCVLRVHVRMSRAWGGLDGCNRLKSACVGFCRLQNSAGGRKMRWGWMATGMPGGRHFIGKWLMVNGLKVNGLFPTYGIAAIDRFFDYIGL